MLKTVEDVIEHLSNQSYLEHRDSKIVRSLTKQFSRDLGLTDRQLQLARKIAHNYLSYITNLHTDALEQNRLPLRSIDRSKWIRRLNIEGENKLGIRFVFNKKYISKTQTLKDCNTAEGSYYDSDNKTHLFDLSEHNCYLAVSLFMDSGFEIEEELMQAYYKIKKMLQFPEQYAPGIYNFELCNITDKNQKYATQLLGIPNKQNLHMYYDRRNHLGLKKFDTEVLNDCLNNFSPLVKDICAREKQSVFVNSDSIEIDQLFEAIHSLDRFPVLILVGDDPLKDIHKVQRSLKGTVNPSEVSVMFRLNNDIYGSEFNSYVKEEGIHSAIDKNKKVVYINNNTKLNKPLLKSGWKADAFISLGTNPYNVVADYLKSIDLNIYYDNKNNYVIINRFGNF